MASRKSPPLKASPSRAGELPKIAAAVSTARSEKVPEKNLLRLRSISFDQPPFRRLGSVNITVSPRITLIAGRNGVGKSTILALIAGASGITRQAALKTYLRSQPNVKAEEILRLSYERDFVKKEADKPHALLEYEYSGQLFHKKGNVTGTEERLRVVPRNEPKGKLLIDGLTIPADGKVPLPTIYLGMMRVIPLGESDPDAVVTTRVTMHAEDAKIYHEFTNRIIYPGTSEQELTVTAQRIQGTRKHSLYPNFAGYDSTNVSLGQDSLSAIATALASFSKLRRAMGPAYRGGLLVIDELDAGFHPHAQLELFDELKSKARELQIQVVATTHSLTMLEHAHQDIFNDKRTGTPLDQIIYLKGGNPIEVLDARAFDSIHADMHMRLRSVTPPASPVKVYVEDDEAAFFLDAILTRARKTEIQQRTGRRLEIVAAHVGCSNLVHLIKADEYFKSVVIVMDADTGNVSAGGAKNVVRLPEDPKNLSKQSPEVIVRSMCQAMCSDAKAYPKTRGILRNIGADTSYLDTKILQPRRGEGAAAKPIEEDRELAKAWFKLRLPDIKEMNLIEGWVADNAAGVASFIDGLEGAVLEATGFLTKASKKGLAKAGKTS